MMGQVRFDSKKIVDVVLALLCLSLSLFSIYTAMFGVLTAVIQRSTHLMFAMAIVFMNSLVKRRETAPVIEKVLTAILAIAAVIVFGYTALHYKEMADSYGRLSEFQLILGIVAVILVLEGARRTVGFAIPIISLVFLAYALLGNHIPGILQHRGYSVRRVITHLYSSSAGLFSTPVGTASTVIIMFVIFGAFLDATKGSVFFKDIAFGLAGHKKGGPAKAAVIASGLMGMVSGSASANVAATGVYTIPLMKKTGYKSEVAGAIEAVASTGSQIMPPVLGAAGFIIAETLGISYRTVAGAAIIPGLLYFAAVLMMVHLEASRTGLQGMDRSELPSVKKTILNYGHSIIPLVVLIGFIALGYSAMYTGLYAVLAAVAVSLLRKATRIGPKQIVKALIVGSKRIVPISCACAAAGIIIGAVSLTGLGLTLSALVVNISGGNLLLALFLTLFVTLIMGMGLPTAPAYILVAVLIVPALRQLGVPPLAAHLFIFYGAAISSITPPVCMAAYTAASLAESHPIQTGFRAFRLGFVALIMPFFFAYEPALIGVGTPGQIALAVVTGLIGSVGIALFVQGFFLVRLAWPLRIVALVGGLLSIYPGQVTDIIGVICIGATIAFQYAKTRRVLSMNQLLQTSRETGSKAER